VGQRAYCDQRHPSGDAEADAWCESYHRPQLPADERTRGRSAGVGDALAGRPRKRPTVGTPFAEGYAEGYAAGDDAYEEFTR